MNTASQAVPAHATRVALMSPSHLPKVLALEVAAFDDPWSEAQYRDELDNAFAHCRVLMRGEAVVGSLVFRCVAGDVELLRVATQPSERRAGLGLALVQHLLTTCGGDRVTLEVRHGNVAAIGLYGKLGFVTIATRRAYYGDGEDALIMQRDLAR